MKLRFVVAAVSSLLCTSAFAVANSNFGGFYAGARVGGLSAQANAENDSSATFINFYDNDNQVAFSGGSNNVSKFSAAGGFLVGYGKVMDQSNVYLGGELFTEIGSPSASLKQSAYHQEPNDDEDNETLSGQTETHLGHVGFGVDFRPGYLIDNNTMVYGRIGTVFYRETINSQDAFTYNDLATAITTNNALNASHTRNVLGVRVGIGAERHINNNVSATIDYVYTDYGRVSTSGVADLNTNVDSSPETVTGGFINKANGSLTTQTLMFGLHYNFA